jgi:hypothetical protein
MMWTRLGWNRSSTLGGFVRTELTRQTDNWTDGLILDSIYPLPPNIVVEGGGIHCCGGGGYNNKSHKLTSVAKRTAGLSADLAAPSWGESWWWHFLSTVQISMPANKTKKLYKSYFINTTAYTNVCYFSIILHALVPATSIILHTLVPATSMCKPKTKIGIDSSSLDCTVLVLYDVLQSLLLMPRENCVRSFNNVNPFSYVCLPWIL